jgi:hypothetical protein
MVRYRCLLPAVGVPGAGGGVVSDWHEHLMKVEEEEDADDTVQGFQRHPHPGSHDCDIEFGMVNQSVDVLGLGPGDEGVEFQGYDTDSL